MLQPSPPKNLTKTQPVTSIGVYLLLALRLVAPYTLPIGAFIAFTGAGFLYSTIAGLIVFGVCCVVMQVLLELGSRE